MKSLNRTLSLVLVLVMVLGLFGVAGAAFTDQKDAKYTEAVEVMTGIGAIDGYADGSIKPTGTITREEAAKLIVFSILGKTVAEKLTVGATGFSDVDAGRWSAPYISYLVGEGIITGMGDGTFAPTANVTGYQMAKMMLCAAGYGAKGEFTGNSWELAVAVTAGKTKVFADAAGVDYTKAATREEAMLYAFNGITKTGQVTYNKLFDQYSDVVWPTGNAKAGQSVKIAEEIYPTLINPSFALNGVNGYVWKYKGQTISNFVADATVLAESKDGTTYTALTTNNNKAYIGYAPNKTAGVVSVSFYVNGILENANAIAPANLTTFNALAAVQGAVVSFTDNNSDGLYDIVSITKPDVSTIGGEVVTSKSGDVTYVTVPGIAGLYKINAENVYGYEGLKKDDIVLSHSDGQRFFITKCASFTGTTMAINTTAKVAVIDGKQYKMSGLVAANILTEVSETVGMAGTTFYVDEGGYIVSVSATEAAVSAANAVYVKATSYAGFTGTAMAVFSDGKVMPITVAKIDNANPTDGTTVIGNLPANKFYTFTKNENGSYNLKTVAAGRQIFNDYGAGVGTGGAAAGGATVAANDTVVITKGAAQFLRQEEAATLENVYGTSTTAFVYADAITRSYTGISNAPTYKVVTTAGPASITRVAVLKSATGYAQFVVAYNGTVDLATTASNYAFVTKPATTFGTGTAAYDMYYAVKDGDPTATFKADTGLGLQMGALYALNAFDGDKVSAAGFGARIHAFGTDGTGEALAGIEDFAVNGTTVRAMVGGTTVKSFVVSADCKVFTYDITDPTDPQLVPSTLGVINSLLGDTYTVQGLQKSVDDATITELYVTIQDGNSATLMGAKAEWNVAAPSGTLVDITGAALANGAALNTYTSAANGNVSVVVLAVPYGATVTATSSEATNVSVGSAGADDTTNTLYKAVKFLITDVNPGVAGVQTITFTITSADGTATSTHTVVVTAL